MGDTLNNAERIRLPVTPGDSVSVTVTGTNLATSSQEYALVVTGCFGGGFPTRSPTKSPSPTISPAPTPAPTGAPAELVTTFSDNNGSQGNMFDIKALQDLTVTEMDVNTSASGSVSVTVYTKSGTYSGSENDSSAWTNNTPILSTSVASQGSGNPTPLPAFDGVAVASGATQAFFVVVQNIRYTNGSTVGTLLLRTRTCSSLKESVAVEALDLLSTVLVCGMVPFVTPLKASLLHLLPLHLLPPRLSLLRLDCRMLWIRSNRLWQFWRHCNSVYPDLWCSGAPSSNYLLIGGLIL